LLEAVRNPDCLLPVQMAARQPSSFARLCLKKVSTSHS